LFFGVNSWQQSILFCWGGKVPPEEPQEEPPEGPQEEPQEEPKPKLILTNL